MWWLVQEKARKGQHFYCDFAYVTWMAQNMFQDVGGLFLKISDDSVKFCDTIRISHVFLIIIHLNIYAEIHHR